MCLYIYNMVVEIIGVLPIELNFIYGFCTILLFSFILMLVAMPWVIVYKLFS